MKSHTLASPLVELLSSETFPNYGQKAPVGSRCVLLFSPIYGGEIEKESVHVYVYIYTQGVCTSTYPSMDRLKATSPLPQRLKFELARH